MKSIFFDLETTDLNFIGQILNYAFVEVNEDWSIESKLTGTIKISRLQLPNPYAILATGIDVLEHNNSATDLEHIALVKIQKYLQGIIEKQPTRLIGYNSNNFDVPFLRTSMIRNGLNPYFGGSVKYGDLIHAVKRVSSENDEFISLLDKREDGKPSYRLESVTKSLGLLDRNKKQDHESLSDVLLTIELAKHLSKNYDLDIRTYDSYEAKLIGNKCKLVKVYPRIERDNTKTLDEYCYYALLEQNKTQALWINLKKFEDGMGKESVSWYNKNTSPFFIQETITDENQKLRAIKARESLSNITLENFWPDKNCDVEQFIYMLPINEISALYDAIWRKDLYMIKERQSKYASQLYLRFLCNNKDIDVVESQIKNYALYRYGGRLKLDKENFDIEYQEGVYSNSFHPTYKELIDEIDKLSQIQENYKLMTSLKQFYTKSVISTICGKELLKIHREKVEE